MKKYIVHLDGDRSVPVAADSYHEHDGRLIFFVDGAVLPDVYFVAACVDGVSLAEEDDNDSAMSIAQD